MIRLPDRSLPSQAQEDLRKWQDEIDAIPDYAEQVKEAEKKFKKRNTRRNSTFRIVRETLTQMCSGARRCGYCEDSVADEVEHIRPKNFYPEATFIWENYLYICGPCNISKLNKFAVFSLITNQITELRRPRGALIMPPESGDLVFINPRYEDPLEYMELELQDTFYFRPIVELGSTQYQRAQYTIEILELNRDYLPAARAGAYRSYRARLREYVSDKEQGKSEATLQDLIQRFQEIGHPTVWREMQRQQAQITELAELFEKTPEAMTW